MSNLNAQRSLCHNVIKHQHYQSVLYCLILNTLHDHLRKEVIGSTMYHLTLRHAQTRVLKETNPVLTKRFAQLYTALTQARSKQDLEQAFLDY